MSSCKNGTKHHACFTPACLSASHPQTCWARAYITTWDIKVLQAISFASQCARWNGPMPSANSSTCDPIFKLLETPCQSWSASILVCSNSQLLSNPSLILDISLTTYKHTHLSHGVCWLERPIHDAQLCCALHSLAFDRRSTKLPTW